jgi:signal transduction histidine kinase/DNA-binding response OmpR family regulator/CHASE3 domain sensor protein
MNIFSLFSIKSKLSAGFATMMVGGALMVGFSLFSVDEITGSTERVSNLRVPTALSGSRMLNNINSSFANLRGYMLTGDKTFKSNLADDWKYISSDMILIEELSKDWAAEQNIERWQEFKDLYSEFHEAQVRVQSIAHTADEQPALKILIEEALPRADVLNREVTGMIDEEVQLEATPDRKALLGTMADIRETMALALTSTRRFLLTGDERFYLYFEANWDKNTRRYDKLNARIDLLTQSQRERVERFGTVRTELELLLPKMFEIRRSEQWNMANYILITEVVPRCKILLDILEGSERASSRGIGGLVGSQAYLLMNDTAEAVEDADILRVFLWTSLCFGIIFSTGVVVVLAHSIVNPVSRITEATGVLASGDLGATIPDTDRNDEIGKLAKGIFAFQTQLIEAKKVRDEQGKIREETDKVKSEFIFAVSRITEATGVLASGDLGATIPDTDRNDEIGKLAKGIFAFQTQLIEAKKVRDEQSKIREEIDKAKSEFISTVSHELRTPLTSIKGALGLMRSGSFDEQPNKLRPMLDIAYNNSERLVALINDILDMEKIEAGMLRFMMQPTDLASLLEEAVEANQSYGDKYDVTFTCSGTDEPLLVNGDKDRLMQVLANLFSNAAKFSPRGGQVEVSLLREGDWARIAVKDSGNGIPEAARETIFEKFTQADSSDQRQMGGTGLGLSIAKMMVEKLDGAVSFTTEVGKGTTFYVDIPMLADIALEAVSEIKPPVNTHSPHLLICEDEPDVANLLKLMLEKAGYSTRIAQTAFEAKQLLKTESFDGLTLDLVLPDKNGITLLQELRADPKIQNLPVVVVSAYVDEGKEQLKGDAFGMIEWIQKPIDAPLLMSKLERALGHVPNTKPHILHVEDEVSIRHIVSSLIGDKANIVNAGSLKEAKAALALESFDLVITELELPDGNGKSLLPLLKISPQISPPVVIFAAKDPSDEVVKSVQAVLTKSQASNKDILQVIQAAMENRQVANAINGGKRHD